MACWANRCQNEYWLFRDVAVLFQLNNNCAFSVSVIKSALQTGICGDTIAGASYLLAAICRQKLSVGLLLATVLMAFSIAAVRPVDELNPSKGDLRPAVMASAVKYMNATIPKGDLILVDFQSSLPATYYLCGPKVIIPMETWGGEYHMFACDGYPVISLHIWKVIAQSFSRQFQNMAQSHGLRPGERVWVFQSGWGADLGVELPGHDPKFRCLSPKNFGGSVTLIPLVVDQDLSPAFLPPGSCANQKSIINNPQTSNQ